MAAAQVSPLTFSVPAQAALRDAAAQLLLRNRGIEAATVLEALVTAESLAANPGDALSVAERGEQVTAAMFSRAQLGNSAVVWSPRLAAEEPVETAVTLVKMVLDHLHASGVQIVQAYADVDAPGDERLLQAAGFERVAELLYLVWLSDAWDASADAADDLDEALKFVSYSEDDGPRLARVVEQTYEGTLDCPQLNGVRHLDDVLAGYRATGEFDPQRWLIVRRAGQDVGCLLLAAHPETDQWELVYLGVTPAARGSGLGRQIVRQAQRMCHRGGARQLVLAVDANNTPALKLYTSAGFVAWDRRPIYLHVFTRPTT